MTKSTTQSQANPSSHNGASDDRRPADRRAAGAVTKWQSLTRHRGGGRGASEFRVPESAGRREQPKATTQQATWPQGHVLPRGGAAAAVDHKADRLLGPMLPKADEAHPSIREQGLLQYLAELQRSNELLAQFASLAAHDLQTPLQALLGYLELLLELDRGEWTEDANRFLANALKAARRLRTMTEGLLDLAQASQHHPQFGPADLQVVLLEVLDSLQMEITESGATVTYDALPMVRADEVQLGEVLQNLIGNALKFRRDEPPQVHVTADFSQAPDGNGQGPAWILTVDDNGIGLDPAQAKRAFELFERLQPDGDYPGTGLGLAICRRIIESHGGRIWVQSEPGRGSTFCFSLPA